MAFNPPVPDYPFTGPDFVRLQALESDLYAIWYELWLLNGGGGGGSGGFATKTGLKLYTGISQANPGGGIYAAFKCIGAPIAINVGASPFTFFINNLLADFASVAAAGILNKVNAGIFQTNPAFANGADFVPAGKTFLGAIPLSQSDGGIGGGTVFESIPNGTIPLGIVNGLGLSSFYVQLYSIAAITFPILSSINLQLAGSTNA